MANIVQRTAPHQPVPTASPLVAVHAVEGKKAGVFLISVLASAPNARGGLLVLEREALLALPGVLAALELPPEQP